MSTSTDPNTLHHRWYTNELYRTKAAKYGGEETDNAGVWRYKIGARDDAYLSCSVHPLENNEAAVSPLSKKAQIAVEATESVHAQVVQKVRDASYQDAFGAVRWLAALPEVDAFLKASKATTVYQQAVLIDRVCNGAAVQDVTHDVHASMELWVDLCSTYPTTGLEWERVNQLATGAMPFDASAPKFDTLKTSLEAAPSGEKATVSSDDRDSLFQGVEGTRPVLSSKHYITVANGNWRPVLAQSRRPITYVSGKYWRCLSYAPNGEKTAAPSALTNMVDGSLPLTPSAGTIIELATSLRNIYHLNHYVVVNKKYIFEPVDETSLRVSGKQWRYLGAGKPTYGAEFPLVDGAPDELLRQKLREWATATPKPKLGSRRLISVFPTNVLKLNRHHYVAVPSLDKSATYYFQPVSDDTQGPSTIVEDCFREQLVLVRGPRTKTAVRLPVSKIAPTWTQSRALSVPPIKGIVPKGTLLGQCFLKERDDLPEFLTKRMANVSVNPTRDWWHTPAVHAKWLHQLDSDEFGTSLPLRRDAWIKAFNEFYNPDWAQNPSSPSSKPRDNPSQTTLVGAVNPRMQATAYDVSAYATAAISPSPFSYTSKPDRFYHGTLEYAEFCKLRGLTCFPNPLQKSREDAPFLQNANDQIRARFLRSANPATLVYNVPTMEELRPSDTRPWNRTRGAQNYIVLPAQSEQVQRTEPVPEVDAWVIEDHRTELWSINDIPEEHREDCCHAVVLEHVMDGYTREMSNVPPESDEELDLLRRRATAKLMQLPFVTKWHEDNVRVAASSELACGPTILRNVTRNVCYSFGSVDDTSVQAPQEKLTAYDNTKAYERLATELRARFGKTPEKGTLWSQYLDAVDDPKRTNADYFKTIMKRPSIKPQFEKLATAYMTQVYNAMGSVLHEMDRDDTTFKTLEAIREQQKAASSDDPPWKFQDTNQNWRPGELGQSVAFRFPPSRSAATAFTTQLTSNLQPAMGDAVVPLYKFEHASQRADVAFQWDNPNYEWIIERLTASLHLYDVDNTIQEWSTACSKYAKEKPCEIEQLFVVVDDVRLKATPSKQDMSQTVPNHLKAAIMEFQSKGKRKDFETRMTQVAKTELGDKAGDDATGLFYDIVLDHVQDIEKYFSKRVYQIELEKLMNLEPTLESLALNASTPGSWLMHDERWHRGHQRSALSSLTSPADNIATDLLFQTRLQELIPESDGALAVYRHLMDWDAEVQEWARTGFHFAPPPSPVCICAHAYKVSNPLVLPKFVKSSQNWAALQTEIGKATRSVLELRDFMFESHTKVEEYKREVDASFRIEAEALKLSYLDADRLWTFVRQMSGTMSESADSVIVVDMRNDDKATEARQLAKERVLQGHAQMLRTVMEGWFKSLTLQVGKPSLAAASGAASSELSVFADSVRQRLDQLARNPPPEGAYFAHALEYEQLLATSNDRLTLSEVIQQLQNCTSEVMKSVSNINFFSGTGQAHRDMHVARLAHNSHIVQWRDESKAAIRRAFDLVTRECQHRHVRRRVSAYELIEGASAALCNYFAEVCALTLTTSRMRAPHTAMYVSRTAMLDANMQLRIAMDRLFVAIHHYVDTYTAPHWPEDEANMLGCYNGYFKQPVAYNASRTYAAPPLPPLVDKSGWHSWP